MTIETQPAIRLEPPKIDIPRPTVAVSPPPSRPQVELGVFRQLNTETTAPNPTVAVRAAGFDQVAKLQLPQGPPSSGPVVRAGFGQPENSPVPAQTGTVHIGRFSTAREAPGTTGPVSGAARTGVFGATAAPHSDPPAVRGAPARTAFDRPQVEAHAPDKPALQAVSRTQPVEILDKPRPRYTEEARKARIEGAVHLEVVFTARGQVQVRRVVKGLGYGLDEAAIEAAGRIRFTPAKVNGTAVDQTALLQVTFLLSQ